jgi:hypothetical protein
MLEPRRLLAVSFSYAINDPGGSHSEFYDEILPVMEEAGRQWGQMFDSTVNIEVDVFFDDYSGNAIAYADAVHFETLSSSGGIDLVELGPVNEIRTGIDPNGIEPDAQITWGGDFLLTGQFFFSTDDERTVPSGRIDALAVILHELGHPLGFLSLLDRSTGEPGQVPFLDNRVAITTLDQYVDNSFGFPAFWPGLGSVTDQVYQPVPMSLLTGAHYGSENNTFTGAGAVLDDLLMSAVYGPELRPGIGEIDLAILADMGLPMSDLVVFPTTPISPILHIR